MDALLLHHSFLHHSFLDYIDIYNPQHNTRKELRARRAGKKKKIEIEPTFLDIVWSPSRTRVCRRHPFVGNKRPTRRDDFP